MRLVRAAATGRPSPSSPSLPLSRWRGVVPTHVETLPASPTDAAQLAVAAGLAAEGDSLVVVHADSLSTVDL